jgi:hypothetical protein
MAHTHTSSIPFIFVCFELSAPSYELFNLARYTINKFILLFVALFCFSFTVQHVVG